MNAEQVGKKAALLSAIEIGIGSLLHGLHVPMAGHLLSLNQGFILSRAHIELQDKRAAGLISSTAALLKSLSPAGKKLTPMLAIMVQGQLFGLGSFMVGNNIVGHGLGMILLCLWGFLQPLFFYTLVYGESLLGMGQFYLNQLQAVLPALTLENLLLALAGVVLLKLVVGLILVVIAHRLAVSKIQAYELWALAQQKARPPRPQRSAWLQAWHDLMTPFFILTLVLMAGFFWFAQSDHAELIWILLRPIAIGYLMFLALRLMPMDRMIIQLQKSNPKLAKSLEEAMKHIRPS